MEHLRFATIAVVGLVVGAAAAAERRAPLAPAAVIDWSNEVRRAIVPAGPGGVFGAENYGSKFPGEAAVYMGIVHAAMYDAAAGSLAAPAPASPAAAIATAAHDTLAGLQPALGLTADQRSTLDARYAEYLAGIAEGPAKVHGIDTGRRAAAAMLALRVNDGRDLHLETGDAGSPPPGTGVWDPGPTPALGLRLARLRPMALESASQFRPAGPTPLTSREYAEDLHEAATLGRLDSAERTPEQTTTALFWTDHDIRQWNDGLLGLAAARQLDLLQTARLLAMAHVAGGDAMIACFDAKYAYWFWRPSQAVPRSGLDPSWQPLRPTPNFPEYPSAHACHTTAVTEAVRTFFGSDRVRVTLDSRVTATSRSYDRLDQVVDEVNRARVLAGFHFRRSDDAGSHLGRLVANFVIERSFQCRRVSAPSTVWRAPSGGCRSGSASSRRRDGR